MIFYQIISEVSFSIPFRIPVFNNTDSQAVWINFLSHALPPYFSLSTMVMWLILFSIL